MSKIRALNVEASVSESEDETNQKLSKEAQEEQARAKYDKALKKYCDGSHAEAVQLFENLLKDPCLQFPREDFRQVAPFQQKLYVGCCKILAELYRDGVCKDLERSETMYVKILRVSDWDSFAVWYRLGKVYYERGELYNAAHAFHSAHSIQTSNWSCLENLIAIYYLLQQYDNCLGVCAKGLAMDEGFQKGQLFRDMVDEIMPGLKNCEDLGDSSEALSTPSIYTTTFRENCIKELKDVQAKYQQRILADQELNKVDFGARKIHLTFNSLTVVDVMKQMVALYDRHIHALDFHKYCRFSWKIDDGSNQIDMSIAEILEPLIPAMIGTIEESQTEEESQSGIVQSQSLVADEGNSAIPSDGTSASQQEANNVTKTAENNVSENSQPLEEQQNVDEAGGKKKGKSAKWWQMEGKRRSQRVRGHLLPTSPDKAKKESSFADQLKNLMPPSLLVDDGLANEKNLTKSPEKSGFQKKVQEPPYFGTPQEEDDLRELLDNFSAVPISLSRILINVTKFLANVVKCSWPSELQELFITLYEYYRSHVPLPTLHTQDVADIVKDVLITVTYMEIVIEKTKNEVDIDYQLQQDIIEHIDFLTEVEESMFLSDCVLRTRWMLVRWYLNRDSLFNFEEAHSKVKMLLLEMQRELLCEPTIIWTVNETSNLIHLNTVSEKLDGIKKVQHGKIVTELYQSERYETLIDTLESTINQPEVEKRYLPNLYFYTVALFRTGRSECIKHCVDLTHLALKFQEEDILMNALLLLDEIWETMKAEFGLPEKRLAAGNLLKILVAFERKISMYESISCIPWCLLHSITFSLEREEPALYLEEGTVPNSVLLLQMAHECMARSERCCVDNGRLLVYTMKAIVATKKLKEYEYGETTNCMEQAIFCLYSHPSKKSKAKHLKDHNSAGVDLTWEMCPILYQYYLPKEDLPGFDSVSSYSIKADVEVFFQRMLQIMPPELKPNEKYRMIMSAIENCDSNRLDEAYELLTQFPIELEDLYYLIGDYYFKNKEWDSAIRYYTWDLAVVPSRLDSWAGIALSSGQMISMTLNRSDIIDFNQVFEDAKETVYCFRAGLELDSSHTTLTIEFGSFVYNMHAFCSRLLKHQTVNVNIELFKTAEKAKDEYLDIAFKCFKPIAKDLKPDHADENEEEEEDSWVPHYMVGKVMEKRCIKQFENNQRSGEEELLKHYELAAKLLDAQGAPYPAKMNYYNPPDNAIEALEMYYRIHASILALIERYNPVYSLVKEKLYLKFIRRAAESPFVKSRQKGKKSAEETLLKKDIMSDVKSVVGMLVDKTVLGELNPQGSSTTSAATSTTSTENESSSDSVPVSQPKPPFRSYGLSEFQKIVQADKLREEKVAQATELKQSENPSGSSPPTEDSAATPAIPEQDIYEGLDLENNSFYEEFKGLKYGAVIALCLKAMEECISRYPSHFKSYFRLANSYMVFLHDAKKAKDYLMGHPELSQRKIAGLFGERKTTNFFNGIWRYSNPDMDKPGSFSYHMNKVMHLLIDVLSQLNDCQLLVEIVLQLTKVPDAEKKYLSNPDREMFCQQALDSCIASLKKKMSTPGVNYLELGIEGAEMYAKLQKLNGRQSLVVPVLHELYKTYMRFVGMMNEAPTAEQAVHFFMEHYQINLKASRAKATFSQNPDQQKTGGSDAGFRKRGRRAARQASQEAAEIQNPQNLDLDIFNVNDTLATCQASNVIDESSPPYPSTIPSITNMYPTMDMQPKINQSINCNMEAGARENYSTTMRTADARLSNLGSLFMRDPINSNMAHEISVLSQDPVPAHSRSASAVPDPHSKNQHQPLLTSKPDHPRPRTMNPKPGISRPPSIVPKPGLMRSAPFMKSSVAAAAASSSIRATATNERKMPALRLSVTKQLLSDDEVLEIETRLHQHRMRPSALPPPNPSIRINTSPWKAQSIAMAQPPTFQYSQQTNPASQALTSRNVGVATPPAAHHSSPPKRSPPEESEGVDLTTKPPAKKAKTQLPRTDTTPVSGNLTKRTTIQPQSSTGMERGNRGIPVMRNDSTSGPPSVSMRTTTKQSQAHTENQHRAIITSNIQEPGPSNASTGTISPSVNPTFPPEHRARVMTFPPKKRLKLRMPARPRPHPLPPITDGEVEVIELD